MKKSQKREGDALLAQSEKTLREFLIDLLEDAPETGAVFLINTKFFPSVTAKGLTNESAEALLEGASSAVDLRKSLGLPVLGSVGKLYLDACEELACSENLLNDPAPLAAALLNALKGKS